MTQDELIKYAYEVLERAKSRPPEESFQRLVDAGVIDEKGRVLLSWDADLAVIAVKRNGANRIDSFRCLKAIPGMPGWSHIDVSREAMVNYLGQEGKRIITAWLNERQNRWKEGMEVHLTPSGYLRTDANDAPADDLGEIPEIAGTPAAK